MYICYVDEAGCTGALPGPGSQIQPVFTILGLIVHEANVIKMTRDLINLKQRYFPNGLPSGALFLDWMAYEVKGSDLRRMARSKARNERRFSYQVIQSGLDIITGCNAKVVGRVMTKPIGGPFDGTSIYSRNVQRICADFQHYLFAKSSRGLVIADSRNKAKNANISHSIFTQVHSAQGNPYPNLVETPTFGHSDNHAGLQLCDLLCSALLFPIAAQLCCLPYMTDLTHCHGEHATLRTRYGATLQKLEHRYQYQGAWFGGINLVDPVGHKKSVDLFRP